MTSLKFKQQLSFVMAYGFAFFSTLHSHSGLANTDSPSILSDKIYIADKYTLKPRAAFRFNKSKFGTSSMSYSAGKFAVDNKDSEIFIAGHSQDFSLGSFAILPEERIGKVSNLPILPITQPFVKISPIHIPQGSADRIMGIEVLAEQLLVTTNQYYDANANNQEDLVVFNNKDNLQKSKQVGYFQLTGRAHATGWMTKLPKPLEDEFNALYLIGSSSSIPINSRLSIGPTLFTWFPFFLDHMEPQNHIVTTTPIIDYSLENPLHKDGYNESGTNDMWTELSSAVYGFITPDKKHYFVLGSSGGHKDGVGYKVTQDNGRKCGGPCSYKRADNYNYFWLYDLEDLRKISTGSLKPYQIVPKSYGKLNIFGHQHLITGADFNPSSKKLYLLFNNLDSSQSEYYKLPVLVVFDFDKV